MTITRGFGMTIDLKTGHSKSWAAGGSELTQEMLNSMMRNPGERPAETATLLPKCPGCGERYCGDGVAMCLECKATDGRISPTIRPE